MEPQWDEDNEEKKRVKKERNEMESKEMKK